jgi:hypothetical protein
VPVKKKRRGRKPKRKESDQVERFEDVTTSDGWCPTYTDDDYEKEVDGEEYDFSDPDEYKEYFDDD